MKKAVIFDFDGTICDTLSDCADCYNAVLRSFGYPEKSEDIYRSVFGNTLAEIVRRILPEEERSREKIDAVAACYRKTYASWDKKKSLPFPGVMDSLLKLREAGLVLAVNSNKVQEILIDMTEHAFPGIFSEVIGHSSELPGKPDPAGVLSILGKYGLTAADAVYVGDGRSDIETAENAGIPIVFVTWGQTPSLKDDKRITRICDTGEALSDIILSM